MIMLAQMRECLLLHVGVSARACARMHAAQYARTCTSECLSWHPPGTGMMVRGCWSGPHASVFASDGGQLDSTSCLCTDTNTHD